MMPVNSTAASFTKFKTRLFRACAAVFILFIAAQIWKVNADYQAAISSTVAQTENLVRAIEAHAVDAIEAMNAPLSAVAEAIALKSEGAVVSANEVKSILTSPLLPGTAKYWVMFIDADGKAVAASNDLPVNGVSYADREYFNTQKTRPGTGLFLGDPSIGRISRKKIYFVSKRVEDAGHTFLGVVVACVDSTSLAKVLQQSLYQKSLSITVLNTSGKIIARVPRYEESFGRDISKSDLFLHLEKARSGNYRAVSIVENDLRIYSYRALSKFPLIIAVGMSSPLLITTLIDDTAEIAAGLLAVLFVLLLGSRFALRSVRDIERYAHRQQELNFQLDLAKSEVEAGERRARMIADNMPALVAYIDAEQRYKFRNSYYREVPEINYENMLGKTMRDVFGLEMHAAVEDEVLRALHGETVIFERELRAKNGSMRWLRYQYSPDVRDDGTVAGFYTLVTDVTDMKAVQHQLLALARIDGLTGLPNRTALCERIAEAVARNTRRNHVAPTAGKIGCLFLDIDHFKTINDTYGHACGDTILKEFGARLKTCIRQSDMAARLAGDEFVILLEGIDLPYGATAVATKVLDVMAQPFITDCGRVSVTTSIGVAISAEIGDTADSLLKAADTALYQAKNQGRNTFSVHAEISTTS